MVPYMSFATAGWIVTFCLITDLLGRTFVGTKMKVLLTKDVEHLGRAGDLKEVSGGYGRNFLVPKGQVKQAEERLKAERRRVEIARRDAEAIAARLTGQTLHFVERVGEQDRLYGSVTNVDIANKIQEQLSLEVDRRRIDLEDPIKRVGNYPVKIQIATGVSAVINVVVEGEGGSAEAAPAEASESSEETAAE
jgi:large subunit ribosomal protein L9